MPFWLSTDDIINNMIHNYFCTYNINAKHYCKWCLRLRSCLFCEGRISVLKRWFKTPIQNALIQAIVRAQVNRKGVYMTSFKRGYNVILRSCFPPESAFCSNHDRKRTFLGCVHAYFAKGVLKRWFKTPIQNAVHGSTVHASLDDTFTEEGMSRNSRNV